MTLGWNKLRPWNGSQEEAFEELCCQVFRQRRDLPDGSRFTRKAPPDAGVECFWTLPSGDEWGLQAKFFTGAMGTVQWRQLNESFATALAKHPRLVRYVVCLPRDREDPRVTRKASKKAVRSFMSDWERHVTRWQAAARVAKREVEVEYCGSSELWFELSREVHAGRRAFWFGDSTFSADWFARRLQEAVDNAGDRYTPALHVEVPVSDVFDGLGRTAAFHAEFAERFRRISQRWVEFKPSAAALALTGDAYKDLKAVIASVLAERPAALEDVASPISFDSVGQAVSRAEAALGAVERQLRTANSGQPSAIGKHGGPFENELRSLRLIGEELYALDSFCEGVAARSASRRALMLRGGPGQGKTHLLCDLASRRLSDGLPTVLLLGEQFHDAEPWQQVFAFLGVKFEGADEFLGALDAAGEAAGGRALVLIDALNEGAGRSLWRKHLAGFLDAVERHPNVAIAVSIRTPYEDLIAPRGALRDRSVEQVHDGFADVGYTAQRRYFAGYGIELPSVPALHPEFYNPLFLKTFCAGLHNRRLTRVPSGLDGITSVFDFFAGSLTERTVGDDWVVIDPHRKLVGRIAVALAGAMASSGRFALTPLEAEATVAPLLSGGLNAGLVVSRLVSEGLLSRDLSFLEGADAAGEPLDVLRFAYERFADHFVVRGLIDASVVQHQPRGGKPAGEKLRRNSPVHALLRDHNKFFYNRGLIEALAVQLPERVGHEVYEPVPAAAGHAAVRFAFLEALAWRQPDSIGTGARAFAEGIADGVHGDERGLTQFLEMVLTVSAHPTHPFNAEYLHRRLMRMPLHVRDGLWSTFLHGAYGDDKHRGSRGGEGPVDRLIDWAWSGGDKRHIGAVPLRLAGTALAWMLTTSNRFVRDRATKALVSLFEGRLAELIELLSQFAGVNDPYVTERLYAVACGVAMRSPPGPALAALARAVYVAIFSDGNPPPHLLLRDYARGVVEFAAHGGLVPEIDLSRVRGPFRSQWPHTIEPATILEAKYVLAQGKRSARARRIWDSVTNDDFEHYELGASYGLTGWLSERLNGNPTDGDVDAFAKTLPPKQASRLATFIKALGRRWSGDGDHDGVVVAERELMAALNAAKRGRFEESVLPAIHAAAQVAVSGRDAKPRFNEELLKRWVFKRTIELGWRADRFEWFDDRVPRHGRESHKAERIGKKYQWIAFHEGLARLQDSFAFQEHEEPGGGYDGPWQLGRRDIDPTFCRREYPDTFWMEAPNCWWFPAFDVGLHDPVTDTRWLQSAAKLPPLSDALRVRRPSDGTEWYVLSGTLLAPQLEAAERDPDDRGRRMTYWLQAFIVPRQHAAAVARTMCDAALAKWLPESPDLFRVFLGEYPWAAAYRYQGISFRHQAGWTRGKGGARKRLPAAIIGATIEYVAEASGYDCSIDHNVRFDMPSPWLIEHLRLNRGPLDGEWRGADGTLAAFAPSMDEPGPTSLLVSRAMVDEMAASTGHEIVWAVTGEKLMRGRDDGEGRRQYIGRGIFGGAYRLAKGKLVGAIRSSFEPPPTFS